MALDGIFTTEIILEMENFIEHIRPPENIRHKVDIGYKIEEQSIIIFELRTSFKKPNEMIERPIAKTTFVKTQNQWKIFWYKSDMQWHSYTVKPTVKKLMHFLELVIDDKTRCFWG